MLKKSLVALTISAALALPVLAQDWQMPRDSDPPMGDAPGGQQKPLGDFESELDGAMNDLFNRLQPHLNALGDELANTMNDFAPALNEISGLIDDIGNYERPERLENGDILIRRRADAPPPPPVADNLRNMLRPAPKDDPRLNPREGDPPRLRDRMLPDRVLPETDPDTEIEL